MDCNDFLIYLNLSGVVNEEINKIEEFIDKKGIYYEDVFKKDFLKIIKSYVKKSTFNILKEINIDKIRKLEEKTCKNDINIVTYKSNGYPENLKVIGNKPKVLYIKGNILPEDEISISIVGSRKYSSYGRYVANYFATELAKMKVTIVSGMAYGIDAIAHNAALKNSGRTIAVLGNGVDIIYPKSNKYIYNQIIEDERGAVISEYPPGTPGYPFRFPERNRIVSGLSRGTIVAEAKERSGSLITARVAAEQGREVFAVPGNINSFYTIGTNRLIRDGATPLLDIEDIILALPEIEKPQKKEKMRNEALLDLSEDERIIYDLIASGVCDINIICEKMDYEIPYISSLLTILELKGLVECENNKDFNIITN